MSLSSSDFGDVSLSHCRDEAPCSEPLVLTVAGAGCRHTTIRMAVAGPVPFIPRCSHGVMVSGGLLLASHRRSIVSFVRSGGSVAGWWACWEEGKR